MVLDLLYNILTENKTENLTPENYNFGIDANYYFIGLNLVGLILTGIIFLLLLNQWKNNEQMRSVISPILAISAALVMRPLFVIVNHLVLLSSDNQLVLSFFDVYRLLPWYIIFIAVIPLTRNMIKVPKRREKYIERIILIDKITIVLLLLFLVIFLDPFPEAYTTIVELGLLIFFLLIPIVLGIFAISIWRESNNSSSKLTQIRLQMIAVGIGAIFLNFAYTPINIAVIFTDNYSLFFITIDQIFVVVSSVIASYAFYSSFFIPDWLKRRNEISTSSLI